MSEHRFKIVIVGGSVTGLVLAHSLDKIGVEYVILEKRDQVAPQEGASIGILPNGARILEQLGVYDAIEKAAAPMGTSNIYFPDGFHFSSPYPEKLLSNFGYPIAFMERQTLLQILYDSLPDKNRVKVQTTVARIEQQPGSGIARIHTTNGDVYEADLVVGADGVHSVMRSEMWKETGSEIDRMTVDYSCIFGMSRGVSGLEKGQQVMKINDGWSLVVIPSRTDITYWFLVEKLDRRYNYADAPRYTQEDAVAACSKLIDLQIWKDVRFGDVWEKRQTFNMTSLQETVFSTWHSGRLVCIGDSIHKMTVNLGQGANCAIEDVAVLTNLLEEFLRGSDKPHLSDSEIDALLGQFNKIHHPRVSNICATAWMTCRTHARDGLVSKLLGRYAMPYAGFLFEGRAMSMIAGAATLNSLPIPRASSQGWYKYNSKGGRSAKPVILMSMVLFFVTLWRST